MISTRPLVDTLAEQELLESLLDEAKPPLPAAVAHLHYLLATPFRYPPPPYGSRFRSPIDPGVFYAADTVRTACAELGYWRWRFLMESPALEAIGPKPQTLFQAEIDTLTIDLRAAPFSEWRDKWVAPSDYAATQEIARLAREVEIGAIRYESVRAPNHGGCASVLLPTAFALNQPQNAQTWWLSVNKERVMWQRDDVLQRASFEFDTQTFGS